MTFFEQAEAFFTDLQPGISLVGIFFIGAGAASIFLSRAKKLDPRNRDLPGAGLIFFGIVILALHPFLWAANMLGETTQGMATGG